MAARAKKKIQAKRFAHAISVHYQDFEHAYVYWIWLRGSASYVINYFKICCMKKFWFAFLISKWPKLWLKIKY